MLDIKQAFNTSLSHSTATLISSHEVSSSLSNLLGGLSTEKAFKSWCLVLSDAGDFFFHSIFSISLFDSLWKFVCHFAQSFLTFHLLLAMCKTELRTRMCSTQTNPSKPRWVAPALPREIKFSRQKVWNLGTVIDTGACVCFWLQTPFWKGIFSCFLWNLPSRLNSCSKGW